VSRRSRIVGFGSAALLVLAGAVCAVLVSGELGAILALVLISLGCVDAVSLVFAEVGFSEDRERARQTEQATRAAERAARAARPAARSAPRRLDRMRGRRRRLR
jgi:hypothetical protein